MDNSRNFHVGPDPFGRTWQVQFLWQQTAISIRHSDSVDVKFLLNDGEAAEEKVIALPHPLLVELSGKSGQPVSDPWCMKLAALHLRRMVETGDDMEKTLVTLSMDEMERAHAELALAAAR
jgi:hypothetical protein